MATRFLSSRQTLSIALAFCAACSGGGGGDDGASVSGTILFLDASTPLTESEPNDAFDSPTPVGALATGETRMIAGELSDVDRIDGFSLLVRGHVLVTATLRAEWQAGALELAAWDPVTQTFGAAGRAAGPLLTCKFDARGAFDLIVSSSGGSGRYTLDVRAEPSSTPSAGAAASATRGIAPRPGFAVPTSVAGTHADYLRSSIEARTGELLVLPRGAASLASELAARQLRVAARIPGSTMLVEFDLPAGLDRDAAARETVARMRSLGEEPWVEYSELNLIRRICAGIPAPIEPNDEFYSYQWHYPLLHLPEAWGITTGDPSIRVAVVDTGETAHPDLVDRQVPGYDLIMDPTIAADGDGIDPDATDVGDGDGLQPSSFHGTHVAGTIGASTNDAVPGPSLGVAGVTWFGEIMHVRVLGKGGGTDFDIANGIRFAAGLPNSSPATATPRAHVINLSLGGPVATTTGQNAVTAARNAGCTIFAAAGNNNSGSPFYPAGYNGVISISAVDINSVKAPYSNFHPTVDFCAPGGDVSKDLNADGFGDGVLSTHRDDSAGTFDWVFYQGTSMACPHAAGVAALMLAIDPGQDLTPAQIESLLTQSVVDLGATGHDSIYGFGLIQAFEAVLAAQGGAQGTPILSVSPTSLNFGAAQTTLTVQITNLGAGTLDVSTIIDTTQSFEDWLTVVPGPPTAASNVGSLAVTVDRTGLVDAVYLGNIQVQSDGGTRDIPVTMVVAAGTAPVDVDLFVLAVELDSGQFGTVAQDIVNPTTDLVYALTGLGAGSYLIACGSDDDNDGFICGEGDTYCGLYPALNEPLPLALGDGDNVPNLDFPVTPLTVPTFTLGTPGFRIRP